MLKVDSHFYIAFLSNHFSSWEYFGVENLSGDIPEKVWPVKSFGFTRVAESTDTTQWGLLSIYTTLGRNKGYKLDSRSTDNKKQ